MILICPDCQRKFVNDPQGWRDHRNEKHDRDGVEEEDELDEDLSRWSA